MNTLSPYIQQCGIVTRKNFVENIKEIMQSYGMYVSKIIEIEMTLSKLPPDAERLKQDIKFYSAIPSAVYEGINFIILCAENHKGVWTNDPEDEEEQRKKQFLLDIKASLLFIFPEDKIDMVIYFFQNYCNSFFKLFSIVRKFLLLPQNKFTLEQDWNSLFNQLMFLIYCSISHRVLIEPNCKA